MTRKKTFTEEEVVNVAYKLLKKEGGKHLTARAVAQYLKASTTPVYAHFSSMESLESKALLKAKKLLLEYCSKGYTNDVFLNMGVGVLMFAKDEPVFFKVFFFEKYKNKLFCDNYVSSFMNELEEKMKQDKLYAALSDKLRGDLLRKMSIFTLGYSVLIYNGEIKNPTVDLFIKKLSEIGKIMIDNANERNKLLASR